MRTIKKTAKPSLRLAKSSTFDREKNRTFFVYKPETHLKPILDFVWKDPLFSEGLKFYLKDFCTLSGTTNKLKAEPAGNGKVKTLVIFYLAQVVQYCLQ